MSARFPIFFMPENPTNAGIDDIRLDTQFIGILLKKHFHNAKPVEIVSADVSSAVPAGENFTSCVQRVQLNCTLATGKKKKFSMIVKTELPPGNTRKLFSMFQIFRTEIKMYTTILPFMEDLMEEFHDNRVKPWPCIYGFRRYNFVCFEDLSEKEYIHSRRRTRLDLNHALLVLRSIARFHAMSKVLLVRGLISQDDKGTSYTKHEAEKKGWLIILSVLSKTMLNHWGEGWSDISRKLESIKDNVADRLCDLCSVYDKRFEVLNHGDLWTSNVMFQYMEFEGNPISVKLIDFQLCHLNSFIWDVENFVNMSLDPVVRREKKDVLLAAYQMALEKNLKLFDYAGYIPTLEHIKSESKRIEFAQAMFVMCQPIVTADATFAFDREKMMTHPPEEVIDKSVYSDGKALEAIGDDLKYFEKIGVI